MYKIIESGGKGKENKIAKCLLIQTEEKIIGISYSEFRKIVSDLKFSVLTVSLIGLTVVIAGRNLEVIFQGIFDQKLLKIGIDPEGDDDKGEVYIESIHEILGI